MSRGRWQLTAESLSALLTALGPDAADAAASYEKIRQRLTQLFRWRGCSEPEELVDETLDRVARKLVEGLRIESDSPYRYVVGVAHRVFHEVLRRQARERQALEAARFEPRQQARTAEDERRSECLEACVEALGPDRDWILRFYRGEKAVRIQARKSLAEELGITTNALRIRAHRLRQQIERCVRGCLGTDQEEPAGFSTGDSD